MKGKKRREGFWVGREPIAQTDIFQSSVGKGGKDPDEGGRRIGGRYGLQRGRIVTTKENDNLDAEEGSRLGRE